MRHVLRISAALVRLSNDLLSRSGLNQCHEPPSAQVWVRRRVSLTNRLIPATNTSSIDKIGIKIFCFCKAHNALMAYPHRYEATSCGQWKDRREAAYSRTWRIVPNSAHRNRTVPSMTAIPESEHFRPPPLPFRPVTSLILVHDKLRPYLPRLYKGESVSPQ